MRRRKEVFADRVRKETVNRKVVPLEDVPRHSRDRQPALRSGIVQFLHEIPPNLTRLPFRKTQYALADDVVLDLIGAGRNRTAPRSQHPMRPFAVIDGVRRLVLEDTVRP